MNAVNLKNVSFSYDGKTKILDGVDFFADYGRITLLSGHSGEGKSTIGYIISGIIPNVNYGELTGEVFIDGEDVRGKKTGYICRKAGIVLQNADEQIVHKIVEDEIAFGCENLAYSPERIKMQIEIVCQMLRLDPSWRTRTLSGGQKQRLITASTLAMGQKIIVLDEPLANLDKDGAKLLMTALRSLADCGYCIIIAEHRLDVVLPFADDVWHVSRGKVNAVENKLNFLEERTKKISDTCRPYIDAEPLVQIQGMSFKIKNGREILKNITFDIPKGGRIVLLGENGCGKTTLMRLIARLYKPSGGKIIQNIDKKFGNGRRCGKGWFKKVGVVYQNPDYQLFMPTVRQEICFGAQSEEYAERVAELFGVKQFWNRHPHSLSEGQKRRVSIAAVAAGKPELLLLDEPTVGQDYNGLLEMVRILNDLHDESGNTMVTVTHDFRCAEALCDKSVFIAEGEVGAEGGKELVREYFSKGFIG